ARTQQEALMEDQVFGGEHQSCRPARELWTAIKRCFLGRCPRCGEGRLFRALVNTLDHREHCGEENHHQQANDVTAYLVVIIVGHIVVGAFMGVEATTTLSTLQHLAIWLPATVLATILLLQPVKGAVIGLQWANYMHGFGGEPDAIETHPEA